MNAGWQLLKVFRRGFAICLGVEVVFAALVAINDIRSDNPESVMDSFGVSCFLAAILSLALRVGSRLNTMPFPVSIRQRIWLSVVTFGLLWLSGTVSIFLVLFVLGFSMVQWPIVIILMLQRIPLYVAAYLLAYRVLHLRPLLFGFMIMFILVPQIVEEQYKGFWSSAYFAVLPIALALIAFYCVEIPKQLAGRDRLAIAQGPIQPVSWMPDMHIGSRQTTITYIGEMIDGFVLLGAVLFSLTIMGNGLTGFLQIRSYAAKPWLGVFPILAILFLQAAWKDGYRRALASGLGPHSAVWVSLMPLTLVLSPVAQALGLKKGILAKCDRCHSYKFIWALRCPHCDFSGAGTITNKQMARLARGDTVRVSRVQRVIARLIVPLQILIFSLMFSGIGNRPFEQHVVLLHFQEAQAARQAARAIENWVKANPDANVWLAVSGHSPQAPETYRLQVQYNSEAGYMSVKADGLRWDSAERLLDPLVESLREVCTCTFTTSKMDTPDAISPMFQTRTYLDNRIHWVKRD